MFYSPILFSKNMRVFPQTGAATSHLKYTVLTWAFKPPAEFHWEPTEKSRQVEFSAAHFFRTSLWILEVPVSIQTSAQLSAGLTKHRDHPTYSWVLHLIPQYIRSRASGNGRWCREWRATPQCHRSNSGKEMEGTERNSVCKPIPSDYQELNTALPYNTKCTALNFPVFNLTTTQRKTPIWLEIPFPIIHMAPCGNT